MDYRFRRRRCICSKCYRFVTHLNVMERCAEMTSLPSLCFASRRLALEATKQAIALLFLANGDTLLFLSIEERDLFPHEVDSRHGACG